MQKVWKFASKLLKYIGILFLSLLLLGFVYEQSSRWKLEKKAFEQKTFVKVGAANIHYLKRGKGDTTVVFASGMGSNSTIWEEVQEKVSSCATTLSYDRSGLYLSDRREETITNASVSAELTSVLEKTNCPKPYVLVAHSMAGIYLRPFIEQHKKDLAGIVLMESGHPSQLKKSSKAFLDALKPPPLSLVQLLTETGLYRMIFSYTRINPEIPIAHPIHRNERDFFYRSVKTLFAELKNDQANFDDAARYGDFGDIPLVVISGTSPVRTKGLKDESLKREYVHLVDSLHHDFLRWSTHSKLVEAKQSGHVVQVTEPGLIAAEVIKLLDDSRKLQASQ